MKVAVYCSAKNVIPEEFLKLGEALGRWIGENGHTLVYGGATGGLMTRVSNAAKVSGAEVIGVVPERIVRSGRKADNCDTLYWVRSMSERKQCMRTMADCFVCLPGSYGTLDEMFDAIASGTVGEHHKPVYIVNYKGFYEGLKALTAHMKELQFLPMEENYAPIYVETLDGLFEALSC